MRALPWHLALVVTASFAPGAMAQRRSAARARGRSRNVSIGAGAGYSHRGPLAALRPRPRIFTAGLFTELGYQHVGSCEFAPHESEGELVERRLFDPGTLHLGGPAMRAGISLSF